jgi:hypothetical protein
MEHLESGVQLKTGGCGKMSQPAMGLNALNQLVKAGIQML